MSERRCAFLSCLNVFEPRKEGHKFCSTRCRISDANRRRHEGLKLLAAAQAAPLALEAGVVRSEVVRGFEDKVATMRAAASSTGMST